MSWLTAMALLALATFTCLALARVHDRLAKIWLALDDLDNRKLDIEP